MVPAAFAVGEMVGASGRDVLTAIVAGYEVRRRLGNALDPTSHYARLSPDRRPPEFTAPPPRRENCSGCHRTRSSRRSEVSAPQPPARCSFWSTAPGTSAIRSALQQ